MQSASEMMAEGAPEKVPGEGGEQWEKPAEQHQAEAATKPAEGESRGSMQLPQSEGRKETGGRDQGAGK